MWSRPRLFPWEGLANRDAPETSFLPTSWTAAGPSAFHDKLCGPVAGDKWLLRVNFSDWPTSSQHRRVLLLGMST